MPLTISADRVPQQTAPHVNRAIERATEMSLLYYSHNREQIPARLDELDREWDIERVLEANAATLSVAGSLLGFRFSRVFFGLPVVVGGFLLQHAMQGWCPPLPILRRLGFRTQKEIEQERQALRRMQERGEFGP